MGNAGSQDGFEVAPSEDEDPVEAFASDGADPAFGVGVGLGRANRGLTCTHVRLGLLACTRGNEGGRSGGPKVAGSGPASPTTNGPPQRLCKRGVSKNHFCTNGRGERA
jgi:hypothetical protein